MRDRVASNRPGLRALRTATYFTLLDVAHDLADHVLQTDHQARNKAGHDERGKHVLADAAAMAGHVGSYTALQVAALGLHAVLAGHRPSWGRLAGAVALSAATHAFIDLRWPVRWLLEHTGSPGFADPRFAVRTSVNEILRRGSTVDPQAALEQAMHPVMINGMYHSDQALHRGVLFACAAVLAGGEHR